MLIDGDLMFTWSDEGLIITFLDEETGEEDQYILDEENSYTLLKFLFKKYKNRFKSELLSKLN